MTTRVAINDTTLRDGEQTAGVAFTAEEKISIARALSEAGVKELEIGVPSMGSAEVEVIRAIVAERLPAKLMVWARMTGGDLAAAADCGAHIVNLSISASDIHIEHKLRRSRDWVLERIRTCVPAMKDTGAEVAVGFEDASRADIAFLQRMGETAQRSGATRVRFADTLGVLDPFTVVERVSALKQAIDIDIEIHAHDDLGLATANTLAAVRAGATHLSTTVNGLGERAGNAPLEEVVMALHHLHGIDTGISADRLIAISDLVAEASGRPVAPNKSIVGRAVFTHESGIHVDGLIKDPWNYQAFDPAELGRRHRMMLGKHSGSHAVKDAYAKLGHDVADVLAARLLEAIRKHAMRMKRPPSDADLRQFYLESAQTPG